MGITMSSYRGSSRNPIEDRRKSYEDGSGALFETHLFHHDRFLSEFIYIMT